MVTTTNSDWGFTYEPGTSASIVHVLTHLIFTAFLWGLLLALFYLQALRDRSSATVAQLVLVAGTELEAWQRGPTEPSLLTYHDTR